MNIFKAGMSCWHAERNTEWSGATSNGAFRGKDVIACLNCTYCCGNGNGEHLHTAGLQTSLFTLQYYIAPAPIPVYKIDILAVDLYGYKTWSLVPAERNRPRTF
jgi:hypothetical protein